MVPPHEVASTTQVANAAMSVAPRKSMECLRRAEAAGSTAVTTTSATAPIGRLM